MRPGALCGSGGGAGVTEDEGTMDEPTFAMRQEAVVRVLCGLRDPQERLAWVVERARGRAGFPAERRTEDRLVKGCAARLWMDAEVRDGRCWFRCDSDSAILKAAAGLMCELYDGLPAGEVVSGEPEFWVATGLAGQFTENRRATIRRVRGVIRDFAEAAGRG